MSQFSKSQKERIKEVRKRKDPPKVVSPRLRRRRRRRLAEAMKIWNHRAAKRPPQEVLRLYNEFSRKGLAPLSHSERRRWRRVRAIVEDGAPWR